MEVVVGVRTGEWVVPPFYRIFVFFSCCCFLFICHVASGTLFHGKTGEAQGTGWHTIPNSQG